MKKTLFTWLTACTALGASLAANAAQNAPLAPAVVLLTSIVSPKVWYEPSSWDLNDQLESDFRKAFKDSGYQIVVKHQATAYDLAQALRAPQNVGVFWVSHAASVNSGDSSANPIGRDDVILDMFGVNVKDVFQVVHPNLRWLSVVGCETQNILDDFRKAGMYQFNPDLKIQDYNTTVDAEEGLINALNTSAPVLANNVRTSAADPAQDSSDNDDPLAFYDSDNSMTDLPALYATPAILQAPLSTACPLTAQGILMGLRRSIPSNTPPAALSQTFVYLGGHLLTVLPQANPGDVQTAELSIPLDTIQAELQSSGGSLQIVLSSGFAGDPDTKPVFGSFSFSSVLGSWDLFADQAGDPIGVTSILYNHHGDVTPLPQKDLRPLPVPGCQLEINP